MANSSVFLAALNDLLEDDSFSTGSMEASTALEAGKGLVRGRTQQTSIRHLLKQSMCGPVEGLTQNREKMWRASIRSSTTFISRWVAFLLEAGTVPTPILYEPLLQLRVSNISGFLHRISNVIVFVNVSNLCDHVMLLYLWSHAQTTHRPHPEGKGSGRFRHISWDSITFLFGLRIHTTNQIRRIRRYSEISF